MEAFTQKPVIGALNHPPQTNQTVSHQRLMLRIKRTQSVVKSLKFQKKRRDKLINSWKNCKIEISILITFFVFKSRVFNFFVLRKIFLLIKICLKAYQFWIVLLIKQSITRCRSTLVRHAARLYQHERHPNAQNRLKHYILLTDL